MWLVLVLVVILIMLNYFLGAKLYTWPQNKEYYKNVRMINTQRTPEIAPDPTYVLTLTLAVGVSIGLFGALVKLTSQSLWYSIIFSVMLFVLYWIDISRRVKVDENALILSKAFSKTKEISLDEITGIYIYSYNKKFMKNHAFTTKLVVITKNEKTKFTISSLNNKAVLNMIKNNFGVTDYKIFIANK